LYYIDRSQEQRKKNLFFEEYRTKWSKIFGRMDEKLENKLWEYWNHKKR
jgi:hypothetical protein